MTKVYKAGLYCRLSVDDANNSAKAKNYIPADESVSIENQRDLLSKFAMLNGWIETKTYIDDGYSGGNFQRPGFLEMMEDARKGVINMILVKDLSRLGRDFVEVGRYTDSVFPSLGIRFVSVLDCLDSDGDTDMLHFRSLMNDYHLRDLSNKIKAVFRSKQAAGQCLIFVAPYGYQKSPEDNHRLVIDEPAASVVRQMYEWRRSGMAYSRITIELNRAGIPSPRENWKKDKDTECNAAPLPWLCRTVKLILQNEVYTGNFVMNKLRTRSYKDATIVHRPESEWVRLKGAHEAIISPELWDEVQKVNEAVRNRFTLKNPSTSKLFSGKLICADCKGAMIPRTNKRLKKSRSEIVEYVSYVCAKHITSGYAICSWHSVGEQTLSKIVLEEIKTSAAALSTDTDSTLAKLKRKLSQLDADHLANTRKEITRVQRRVQELENTASHLYEDRVNGTITIEEFTTMVSRNERERIEKTDYLKTLLSEAEKAEQKFADIDKWASLIRKYQNPVALDREMVDELIDHIEIGERSVQNGIRCQDIKIFYRIVGQIG